MPGLLNIGDLRLTPLHQPISHCLFEYLQYWIDAYRRQGLSNVLDGMRLTLSYERVIGHGQVAVLEERDDAAALRLRRVDSDLPVTRNEVEFLAGILMRLGRFARGAAPVHSNASGSSVRAAPA